MWIDPIVEEVRNARDSHARQYNYDLRAIYEALKKRGSRERAQVHKVIAKST